MNAKKKVIDAITHFQNKQAEIAKLEAILAEQRRIVTESQAELIRTLKAVYGGRANGGVVFQGKRYSVMPETGGAPALLSIVDADFEVLG